MEAQTRQLNRFLTLPALMDIVENHRLTFSNPRYWEDENDSELLEIYRKKKNVKTVLAMCFLNDDETIHHWKAFAYGTNGCCIEFGKKKLTKLLIAQREAAEKLKFGAVIYKKLGEINDGSIDDCVETLPFLKRWPYRFEKEFRVIWEGHKDNFSIKIDSFDLIAQITMSQLMPERTFEKIKAYLIDKSIGIPAEKINQSTVYRNENWICKFKERFKQPRQAT